MNISLSNIITSLHPRLSVFRWKFISIPNFFDANPTLFSNVSCVLGIQLTQVRFVRIPATIGEYMFDWMLSRSQNDQISHPGYTRRAVNFKLPRCLTWNQYASQIVASPNRRHHTHLILRVRFCLD